jgi:ATP synthase protein I
MMTVNDNEDQEQASVESNTSPPPSTRHEARPSPSPAPAELPPRTRHKSETDLLEAVSEKELRKLRARQERNKSVWFGLGMFGLVGWSVAVPTVAAIALGVWLDTRFPSQYSWTLMLLVVGVVIGCFNAWYWVSRERDKL